MCAPQAMFGVVSCFQIPIQAYTLRFVLSKYSIKKLLIETNFFFIKLGAIVFRFIACNE